MESTAVAGNSPAANLVRVYRPGSILHGQVARFLRGYENGQLCLVKFPAGWLVTLHLAEIEEENHGDE